MLDPIGTFQAAVKSFEAAGAAFEYGSLNHGDVQFLRATLETAFQEVKRTAPDAVHADVNCEAAVAAAVNQMRQYQRQAFASTADYEQAQGLLDELILVIVTIERKLAELRDDQPFLEYRPKAAAFRDPYDIMAMVNLLADQASLINKLRPNLSQMQGQAFDLRLAEIHTGRINPLSARLDREKSAARMRAASQQVRKTSKARPATITPKPRHSFFGLILRMIALFFIGEYLLSMIDDFGFWDGVALIILVIVAFKLFFSGGRKST